MPPSLDRLVGKANERLVSTIKLYNAQPMVTRIVILLFVLVHLSVFLFLAFVLGPERVFDYTAKLAIVIRSLAYPRLTLVACILLVSFPPMVGYGTLITLSGMAFGGSGRRAVVGGGGDNVDDKAAALSGSLAEAWMVGATGCLLGSLLSFTIMRSVLLGSSLGRRITRIDTLRSSKQWRAMEKAVGQRGLSMAILIRFSPFPFNVSNLFFASLQSVSIVNFMLATVTTTPKLLLHVFIGNRLFQLFDRGARAGLDTNTKILNGCYVVVGSAVGIAASWFVYRETNRILASYQQADEEDGRPLPAEPGSHHARHHPAPSWDAESGERESFLVHAAEPGMGKQAQHGRRGTGSH